jgi:hypothetical protein
MQAFVNVSATLAVMALEPGIRIHVGGDYGMATTNSWSSVVARVIP